MPARAQTRTNNKPAEAAANAMRRVAILQRQCACGQHAPGGGTCSACAKRQSEAALPAPAGAADRIFEHGGQALDPAIQAFMEPRLGHDFSAVRVHTGAAAAASAAVLKANAYTVGHDIVFAAGRYSPGSRRGRELLAHELTHVVQQDRVGVPTPMFMKAIGDPADAAEREADAAASAIVDGATFRPRLTADAVLQGELSGGAIAGIVGGIVGGAVGLGLGIAALLGAFGSRRWSITQKNTDGANYSSDVNITFNPDKNMHCDEIAFVQALKFSDVATRQSVETIPNYVQRRTAAGWTLDRIEARQYGWYGYNNDGRPGGNVSPGKAPDPLTPATLHDTPSDVRPSSVFQFETCGICRSGMDVNKVYSCFNWGFSVDSANKLTSGPNSETAAPSAEFAESVKQWNVQAAGPAAQRNDPTQQPLGPFK